MRDSEKKEGAFHIVQALRSAGFKAYWAGGCVRDLVLGTEPQDYDVATDASTDQIEGLFEKTVPVGKQFGVMLVILNSRQYEVATFRTEGDYQDGRHPDWVRPAGPEADARRRDFTINGLFYDPVTREVIDYVEGQQDLTARRIRAIGAPAERFSEDKLRILRAVRFASVLGFDVEKSTWETVKAMAGEIHAVSAERIRDELVKIFTRPHAGRGLQLLSDSGLLREILPEVEAMKGCRQNPEFHPEGDVFVHTKMLLDKLDHPTVTLAFGALLHDVGKPPTFSDEGGKIHFYEHDHVGAAMTRDIMTRLRFSTKEIESVCEAVGSHMKFMHVQEMRKGKLKTFMARVNFPEELELHKIDCGSSHGKLDNYEFLQGKLKEFEIEELKPKPLINGNDLIAKGLTPGPKMGRILKDAYENQLEGILKSREEALEWALGAWQKEVQS